MTENFGLSLNSINRQNLLQLGVEQSLIEERRILELREAVDELIMNIVNMYDVISAIDFLTLISPCVQYKEDCIHSEALWQNLHRLRGYLSLLNDFDKLLFTDFVVEKLVSLGISVSEKDYLSQNETILNVSYVKNALSDEAYDVFCQDFPRLSSACVNKMNDVAQQLTENKVDCAILPIEEKGGIRIRATSELIYDYDFKINAITPTFGMDGSSETKYALVSRSFSIPKIERGDDLYFEIRVSLGESIAQILLAAEYFGYTVYRVNTVSVGHGENQDCFYTVVFKSENGSFVKLINYLILFIASYTPVGLYKNLE